MTQAETCEGEQSSQRFIFPSARRTGLSLNHRLGLDEVFFITCTESPWRNLSTEFSHWLSAFHQFRRRTLAGLWRRILKAFSESRLVPDTHQMVDDTVIRAHHQVTGAKEDCAPRFEPFKSVRWENNPPDRFLNHLPLHDQDPPPR